MAGVRMLSLRDPSGNTLFVPLEWTDRAAPPSPPALDGPPAVLDFPCLVKLAEWVEQQSARQAGAARERR